MTNFSFGRTDGRTERGNNNIPELSLESAGIKIHQFSPGLNHSVPLLMLQFKSSKSYHGGLTHRDRGPHISSKF